MMFRTIVLTCLIWPFAMPCAYGRPDQVIIIRHAEKPKQGDDLSLKGRERAAALVPFFLDGDKPTPAAIFAQGISDMRHSRRPVQTVTPLAHELNLSVKTYHHERLCPDGEGDSYQAGI